MSMLGCVERALFIMAEPDSGKSTQLTSMLLDYRLGYCGEIPKSNRNLRKKYALSNERWLYLRLTSPHEYDEDLDEFLQKCEKQMTGKNNLYRWNYAGALQMSDRNRLPKGTKVVESFNIQFNPERIRVVLLSPDRFGNCIPRDDVRSLIDELRCIPRCEVMIADATSRTANGLMFSDFFDFS